MTRIQLGQSRPARVVITGTWFAFGVVLLFWVSGLAAHQPDAWRFQLLGAGALLAAACVGGALARRLSSAFALISPSVVRIYPHGRLWPAAGFSRRLIRTASEVRISEEDPLWAIRVVFVDDSERRLGSLLNPAIHEAIRELNAAISPDLNAGHD
jgi:hypothetical protein